MLRFLLGMTVVAAPAFADGQGPVLPEAADVPNVMIVQVPEVNGTQDLKDQAADGDVDVFPLRIEVKRLDDGTPDLADIRAQILALLQSTKPVTVKIDAADATLATLPPELQEKFQEAEADTVAAAADSEEAVVAWRGYGPAGGYRRGVVAFNRGPYRGYYPYYSPLEAVAHRHNPYYGYYANGRNYPFSYVAHRVTPSYHYFGYVRGY